MAKVSAGILLFRRKPNFQVLLGHPGEPYWKNKDEGAWSMPKGIVEGDKTLLEAAKHKFKEKIGFIPEGDYIELGSIQPKDGKTVHAWGTECQIPDDFKFIPDFFEIEWPPNSGQMQKYPEIDRIEYFPPFEANEKINPAQRAFISRLIAECSS